MDNRKRRAARKAAESTEDEARYLVELIRSGVDRRRIELAAYLGDVASQLATGVLPSENISLYHLTRSACLAGTAHFPKVILTWAYQEVAQLFRYVHGDESEALWWESLQFCKDYIQGGNWASDFNRKLEQVVRTTASILEDVDWDEEGPQLGLAFDALAELMHTILYLITGHAVAAANRLENITARLGAIDDIDNTNLAHQSIPNLVKILKDPDV